MKVRELVEGVGKRYKLGSLHADAFKVYGEIVDALSDAGILDAEVIGLPCKTCGGSRKCFKCGGRGWYRGTPDNGPTTSEGVAPFHRPCSDCGGIGICPDCADTPVWVIAPEAWAALCEIAASRANAYREQGKWLHADSPDIQDDAMLYARTLLPGARVAKAVGVVTGMDVVFHAYDGLDPLDGRNVVGDTLAILEDKHE